jgi:molybdate transport system ATP-binding protein
VTVDPAVDAAPAGSGATRARIAVDVSVRLGTFALDVAFDSRSRVVALFGRSGCGKSTVINAIAGTLRPDRGRIEIGGEVLFDSARGIDVPVPRRRVGYVFQDALLFPHLDVRGNLLYGYRLRGSRDPMLQPDRVFALLGLQALLDRRPSTLSGGERQRVAIGRALLSAPRVLLMDEPLAALDAQRRGEILQYIERLRDELDIPIVFVSHSVPEVVRLADDMALMSEGRVVACGPVHALMNRLDLRPLTGRFEAGSLLEAAVDGHDDGDGLTRLRFAGGVLLTPRVDAPIGERVRVRIRARDVSLSLSAPTDSSLVNQIPAIVLEIKSDDGPIAEVAVKCGEEMLIARVTRRSVRHLGLVPGRPVFALVKAVSIDRRSVGFH